MNTDNAQPAYQCLKGDCLELMQSIPDGCIDMVLCDLPYGTTDCKWDSVIPFDLLWQQYNRIIKDNGIIALFGTEPFSTFLRYSNIKLYKYDWIWKKTRCTGFQHAKNMPLKDFEIISIFSKGGMGHKNLLGNRRMVYNPQGLLPCERTYNGLRKFGGIIGQRPSHKAVVKQEFTNYPKMILEFPSEGGLHPTQKPVPLLEYLVKTYTAPGGLVLDNCMGSGSTGVACANTGRRFIGMEMDDTYFNIASERVSGAFLCAEK